ncbi:hypothetical protein THOM_1448 [Trachipleistophora hominis]|uniref:Uncharacterized protein n=1 Tax=Trachipleistophora hominis TaxID=72359 RepID=L7JW86_TRAHO|nr:hypothetical protein THOM_1448 [Trachipleistophora hominis]
MKELTISTFRLKNFNLENLLTEIIRGKNTKEAISQLTELKDAIFHKKQQILKLVKQKGHPNFSEILNAFFGEHNHLHLSALGDIGDAISRYNNLREMKLCKRIIVHIDEMRNGFYENISAIIKTDDINDLYMLAHVFLFFNDAKSSEEDNNLDIARLDRILALKNEFIETARNNFERAQKEKNVFIMKGTYKALKVLKKESVLVNIFMQNLKIFNLVCEEEDGDELVFNLDFFDYSTWFFKFIDTVQETYENELINLEDVLDAQVIQKINEKLFETVISNAVGKLLRMKKDVEFLWYLSNSYTRVQSLYRFVSTFYAFNYNIRDIFSQYFVGISKRENECCDFVLSTMTGEKEAQKKYVLLNEQLHAEQDERTIILKMLCIYNFFYMRSELLKYDSDDVYFVKKHFLKSVETLIMKNLRYNLKNFRKLNEYFFILKKVQLESKFIKDKMREIFGNYLDNSKKDLKIIIKSLTIDDLCKKENRMVDKLIYFLKTENKKIQKYVKGPNALALFYNIVDYAHDHLYKQILTLTYDRERAYILYNDVETVRKFLKKMKVFETPFDTLKNIMELLVLEKDVLAIYVHGFKELERSEIKRILKCRKDYVHVKECLNEF